MTETILRAIRAPQFFPTCLIVLDVCAACRYLYEPGEWRQVVYWLAAATLTTVVTW